MNVPFSELEASCHGQWRGSSSSQEMDGTIMISVSAKAMRRVIDLLKLILERYDLEGKEPILHVMVTEILSDLEESAEGQWRGYVHPQ